MSHYEERLQHDLDEIRDRVATIGTDVETAVRKSVRCLLQRDTAAAADVVLADHPINRATRDVDRLCHVFVARHLPSAGVLRTISAVLRLTIGLERIGDYAVTIARETVQLEGDVPTTIVADAQEVSEHSLRTLHRAMEAFNSRDADLARSTKDLAREGRRTSHRVFRDLVRLGREHPDEHAGAESAPSIADLYALLLCINRMERIGDQAKNICEDALFAVTGEMKQPKVYRVQFVDRANDAASVMAEVIARSSYPESGAYSSSGWQPAAEILPPVRTFLTQRGHDLTEFVPSRFEPSFDALETFHVIVDLDGGATTRIPDLPFHTTVASWDVGPCDPDATVISGDAWLTELYRDVSARVTTLMETLRGDEAR